MASYATVPAADVESEATLLNKPKTKTKSLLVGGVAAAAFVLGALSMTALRTSPSGVLTRTATSLSVCEEFQQWPKFAEKCGSWTLGQCDAEYKEWVAVWKFPSMAWHPIFDVHAGGSAAASPRSSLKISRILIRSTARSTATP